MSKALVYQEEPRCFGCGQRIDPAALVFAALCGHETCASTTWHYHHLMQAREAMERAPAGHQEHALIAVIAVLHPDT